MTNKRIVAYFIDFVIVSTLVSLIFSIYPLSPDINLYRNEMIRGMDALLVGDVSFDTFINRYAISYYNLMEGLVHVNIATIAIVIFCYIAVPYSLDGQTIGKMITKIKISSRKNCLTPLNLFVRSFVINGLGYLILSVVFVFTSNGLSYFLLMSLIGLIQIIFILLGLFMMIFRSTNNTFHDKISYTCVLERSDKNEKI